MDALIFPLLVPIKPPDRKRAILFLQIHCLFSRAVDGEKLFSVSEFQVENRDKVKTGLERENGCRAVYLFKHTKSFRLHTKLFHALHHKLADVF
ncbi:hypothetical protein SDC9_97239 [bioreactor metagenome]|uniref:Uncharacterized protein n=1 Tax=bioreactor metagenome TaxID=1076179 RepID=A0A645ABT9_9ZZZZ